MSSPMHVPPLRHDVPVGSVNAPGTVRSMPVTAPTPFTFHGAPEQCVCTIEAAAQWTGFEDALAALVEVLDTGQFLILESSLPDAEDGTGPYVQLALDDTGIY